MDGTSSKNPEIGGEAPKSSPAVSVMVFGLVARSALKYVDSAPAPPTPLLASSWACQSDMSRIWIVVVCPPLAALAPSGTSSARTASPTNRARDRERRRGRAGTVDSTIERDPPQSGHMTGRGVVNATGPHRSRPPHTDNGA